MKEGDEVHVNRDDPQWGRIAEDGTIIEINGNDVLVEIGGTIRANVLCRLDELTPR